MAEAGLEREVIDILSLIEKKQNFLLSGGAGSGKTYSLVSLLKKVSEKYPKVRIACITYTNAAALEIRDRCHIGNLYVSTIHDFLWDNIRQFQVELRKILCEIVNDPNGKIQNPLSDDEEEFQLLDDIQITYKEYTRILKGEISHDEVLIIAKKMFETYPKLCKIVCSKYPFIFVDEYQDTSPLVIEILLESLQKVVEPSIVGFFGDSMQSIYDEGIGDIENYIKTGRVTKIEKKQNRRNPQKVIELANKLRTDGLMQQASDDANAPNMENGVIKKGSVKFLYGNDLKMAYSSEFMKDWNFENSKQTKELRLTHTLIAGEAHFEELYNIYDSDPVLKLKKDLKAYVKKKQIEIEEDKTFDEVLNEIEWFYQKGKNTGKSHLEVFLDDPSNEKLYSHVKDLPYSVVSKFYWEKDQLIDDKIEKDGKIIRDAKRDALIAHLFRIQDIIALYISSNYRDLLRKIGRKIQRNSDKRELHDELESLRLISQKSIGEVIDFANEKSLCAKSDAFNSFIEKNEYLYWRVSAVPYSVFQNLYSYIEGRRPFSTQHKVKGLEYENVLVILDSSGWNKYNFDYVLDDSIYDSLPKGKKESYKRIKRRTEKLLYVCCTRAKENLVLYYPEPSSGVIQGMERLIGKDNCVNLGLV